MTDLISVLATYNNNLPMISKPYFLAGTKTKNPLLLFKSANLDWITAETTIEEISKHSEAAFKEKPKSSLSLKSWFIKKYVTFTTTLSIANVILKNAKVWGLKIEPQNAIFTFYLGIILQVLKSKQNIAL